MITKLHSLNVCIKENDFMDIRLHKQRLLLTFAVPLRIQAIVGLLIFPS